MDTALVRICLIIVALCCALAASIDEKDMCNSCSMANEHLCKKVADNWVYSMESKVETVTDPEVRVSEKLQCGEHPCELQANHILAFSTKHTWTNSQYGGWTMAPTKPSEANVVERMESVEAAIAEALTGTTARVSSIRSSNSSLTHVCRGSAQQKVWLAVQPQFYVLKGKIGRVTKWDCVRYPISSKIPLLAPDGSIAGERRCVSEAPVTKP